MSIVYPTEKQPSRRIDRGTATEKKLNAERIQRNFRLVPNKVDGGVRRSVGICTRALSRALRPGLTLAFGVGKIGRSEEP